MLAVVFVIKLLLIFLMVFIGLINEIENLGNYILKILGIFC